MVLAPPEPLGDLLARVGEWADDDPSPELATRLRQLGGAADGGDVEAEAELRDLFRGTLAFGTAGLRGAVGPGPHRMNAAVVRRAAAGVAAWVRSRDVAPCVVVGRDARHGSAGFVEDTIAVLAGADLHVHVLPAPVPTPVLAYAARHLDVGAGIMVTASHNPGADNGYKVYDHEGRQVDEAQATAIARAMDGAGRVTDLVLAGDGDPRCRALGSEIIDEYVAATGRTVLGPTRPRAPVEAAYTALHGVGSAVVRRAARASGFLTLHEVAAQAEPDPDFPTVAFPNPEEPGALDLLLAHAADVGADVALANDPDADRLAVAAWDPARGDRGDPTAWRRLSGDQLGWLLADHLVRRGGLPPGGLMATTIVSSTLLRALARDAGLGYAETLTGFKWISRAPGPDRPLVFGYEEAQGYCVGDLVRDKDGIGALLLAAEVVSDLLAQGRTVFDALDDLARRHGVHATGQWSARLEGSEGAARIAAAMDRLRTRPPTRVGGRPVVSLTDLASGSPDRDLPPADVVSLALDGARVVVRPSGTEPKLKCYIEVVEPVPEGADIAAVRAARAHAEAGLAALLTAIPATLGLA